MEEEGLQYQSLSPSTFNPRLNLQGHTVLIGAEQGPCTGSGAAPSPPLSYRSLFRKQQGKLPDSLGLNLQADSFQRQGVRAPSAASDCRKPP